MLTDFCAFYGHKQPDFGSFEGFFEVYLDFAGDENGHGLPPRVGPFNRVARVCFRKTERSMIGNISAVILTRSPPCASRPTNPEASPSRCGEPAPTIRSTTG